MSNDKYKKSKSGYARAAKKQREHEARFLESLNNDDEEEIYIEKDKQDKKRKKRKGGD